MFACWLSKHQTTTDFITILFVYPFVPLVCLAPTPIPRLWPKGLVNTNPKLIAISYNNFHSHFLFSYAKNHRTNCMHSHHPNSKCPVLEGLASFSIVMHMHFSHLCPFWVFTCLFFWRNCTKPLHRFSNSNQSC